LHIPETRCKHLKDKFGTAVILKFQIIFETLDISWHWILLNECVGLKKFIDAKEI
jgi:hypothetical protein